ncbi:MAG: toxin-antitoxin system HicB family antitoxin [Lachnospiraceae bacterium]|nr:toxin-antitoxin system HicB family antitoxin [Lachnospiraceae bacterium]
MKTIEYYRKLPYRLEILSDPEEGGFVARYPDLPGCISSGSTMRDALENAEDAKLAWITAAFEDGMCIPEPASDEDYSGQFKLRIPKSLHRALSEHAKEEGTSMNQYCLYLLTRNDALRKKG